MGTRANAGAPGLLIEIKRYGEWLDPEAMAYSVRKSLGGTFRRTERTENYSALERADSPTRIAAGFYPGPQRRFTVLAIYWAGPADWDAGEGRALVDGVPLRSCWRQPERRGGSWARGATPASARTWLDYSAEGGAIEITFAAEPDQRSLRGETQVTETGRFELSGG